MDANVLKWALFCSLIILNFFDALTTTIVVDNIGIGAEVNLFIRTVLEHYGPGGLYIVKFIVIAFSVKWIYDTPVWVWVSLNLYYLIVVLHNVYIVFSIL